MAAQTPGWRRGSSPEAAKRGASSRRALRTTTVPVKIMNVGCWEAAVARSVIGRHHRMRWMRAPGPMESRHRGR
jgi:hypothetical protein